MARFLEPDEPYEEPDTALYCCVCGSPLTDEEIEMNENYHRDVDERQCYICYSPFWG